MGGWNTIVSFWDGLFSGAFAVSFRDCRCFRVPGFQVTSCDSKMSVIPGTQPWPGCFDWNFGLVLEGWPSTNRGQLGSRYMEICLDFEWSTQAAPTKDEARNTLKKLNQNHSTAAKHLDVNVIIMRDKTWPHFATAGLPSNRSSASVLFLYSKTLEVQDQTKWLVFRMVHVKDSLLPMGKVWSAWTSWEKRLTINTWNPAG